MSNLKALALQIKFWTSVFPGAIHRVLVLSALCLVEKLMHFSISDSVARSSSTCPCQQHQGAGSDSGALWAGTSLHALACGFLLWGSGQVSACSFFTKSPFSSSSSRDSRQAALPVQIRVKQRSLGGQTPTRLTLLMQKTTANMKARRDFSVRPSMKWKAELEAQKCSHLHQKIQQNIAKSSLLLAVRNYVAWVLTTSVSLALGHPVLHVQLPRSWAEPASLMQSCQASWQLACHRLLHFKTGFVAATWVFENWQSTHPVLVEIARAPAQSQYSGPPAVLMKPVRLDARHATIAVKKNQPSIPAPVGMAFQLGDQLLSMEAWKFSLPTVKNSRRGHLTLPCSCSNLWHNRCNLSSLVTELLRWKHKQAWLCKVPFSAACGYKSKHPNFQICYAPVLSQCWLQRCIANICVMCHWLFSGNAMTCVINWTLWNASGFNTYFAQQNESTLRRNALRSKLPNETWGHPSNPYQSIKHAVHTFILPRNVFNLLGITRTFCIRNSVSAYASQIYKAEVSLP